MTIAQYLQELKLAKAEFGNIQNVVAHYLYGTPAQQLAKLSQAGIVYNPPGHGGGR